MARILFATLALLLTVAFAQAPDAIGSLYTRDMGGSLSMSCTASLVYGSDFELPPGPVILTASHCVSEGLRKDGDLWRTTRDYLMTFDERSYHEVRLVRVGNARAGYDAALLEFVEHEPTANPLRLGDWDEVQVGDPITTWSNPAGLGLQRFEGYVSMRSLNRPVQQGSINWRDNAVAILPSAGGSSGSLILGNGDVVLGVLVGGIQPRDGASFTIWVPLWKLHEMVERDSAGKDIAYR